MYNDSDDNDDDEQTDSSTDDNTDDTDDSSDSSGGNSSSANVEEHREAIGNALSEAADRQGISLSDLASQIGLSSDDVNELTHDDLMTAAKHLAREHPDLVESFVERLPLGNVLGGFVKNFLSQ
jgi:ribosome-binding protein aMBF1 (putative translation factor)